MSVFATLEETPPHAAGPGVRWRTVWRAGWAVWCAAGWRWMERRADQTACRWLLLAVLAAVVLVVPPAGEFPVDDDWIYAQTVQRLLTDGQYHRSVWIDSAFLAQAWWGTAASWLFGFSHTTLRLSTLVLAAGAAFVFLALLGRVLRPLPALAVTLLLVFHPLFLHLSYSFMTDVPFMAIMLAAVWCVTVACERPGGGPRAAERCAAEERVAERPGAVRLRWLALGSALIGLACLVRQIGVVLVPAVLVAAFPEFRAARTSRIRLLVALIVPFSVVVALLVYADPRDVTVEIRLMDAVRASDPATLLLTGLRATGAAAMLLGLSALPLAPLLLRWPTVTRLTIWQRLAAATILLLMGVATTAVASGGRLSPLFGNTLSAAGLTVSGLHPRAIAVSAPELTILVSGALLGALALVVATVSLTGTRQMLAIPLAVRLLVLAGLGALVLTVGYGPLAGPVNGLYDRYLLPVVPGVLILTAYAVRHRRAALPFLVVGVLCFGVWSVGWQREYLQRQAAVWQVANALVAQGVAPTDIDAGYEWSGWYRGPAVIEQARLTALASGDSRGFVQLVVDGIYAPKSWYIGFGPLGVGCAGRPAAETSYGAGDWGTNSDGWPVYGLPRCRPRDGALRRPPQAAD